VVFGVYKPAAKAPICSAAKPSDAAPEPYDDAEAVSEPAVSV
jgi:hypothetical protein